VLAVGTLPLLTGCGRNVGSASGSAAIVGTIAPTGGAGKHAPTGQFICPDIIVTLNSQAVSLDLDDDCGFLIDDVQPATSIVLDVDLPGLGVSGTITLDNVVEAELIEILVETSDDSLTISILRRLTPDPVAELPVLISGNNVTIFLPAGIYDQTLTVDGNNFTLVGEAGDDCDATGWTVITGDVFILKNDATFRNVRFEGSVEVQGNNARFINTCLDGTLLIFGNNTEFDDDDNGDDDDDDGGDDDDDDDNDDDDD